MAIIDTTGVMDTSFLMKSKVPKNMVGDNHYILNLQQKRDQDWAYRYNVVGIERENSKQLEYVKQTAVYEPIDVVIRSVKDENGKDLGADYANISFRDLKYPNELGQRYRFNLDFPDMSLMTEEEKHYDTSVWIAINKSPIKPGNSCMVRRCNCNVALVGSRTGSYKDVTEVRYEPAIVEQDLKYLSKYYNQALVMPNAEWYLTLQMNYFTDFIKINDRIIFGAGDVADTGNNTVFMVKAVVKTASDKTFYRNNEEAKRSIPLIILALDKDTATNNDDFENRVAMTAPLYRIPYIAPVNEYNLEVTTEQEVLINSKVNALVETNDDNDTNEFGDINQYLIELFGQNNEREPIQTGVPIDIMQGDELVFNLDLTFNGIQISKLPVIEYRLEGIKEENWDNYFEFSKNEEQRWFKIKNKKMSRRGVLKVKITYGITTSEGIEELSKVYLFKLGGFY